MAQSGYTPILIYASGTASNVPLAANLTSSASGAELALNYADGKLYFKNSSGVVTLLAGSGGGGPAAGSNTQVQFNNNGVFGASANMVFNGTRLTVADLADSGLTAGRVTYASSGGALVDSANLLFDGTTLTANALTTTSTVTINGGTANGVAYLNGSKVLTTGSALTFDGTNLGVGVASPTQLIDGTATNPRLKLTATSTGYAASQFTNSSGSSYFGRDNSAGGFFGIANGTVVYSSTNDPIGFYLGTNEQMRLTSTGLGIGTSSPSRKLEVNGIFRQTDGTVQAEIASGGSVAYYGTNNNYPVAIQVNAVERARFDTSGNLGIGTSSPASKLVVSNGSNKNLEVQPGATTYLFAYDRTASDYLNLDIGGQILTFSTDNGSERMRLDSSGNLGIGTSSPGVKVDAVGVYRGTFNSTSNGGPTTHGLELRQSTTSTKALIAGYSTSGNQIGAYIQAVNFGTAYEDLVIQPQGGNLGIGTSSPVARLTVSGIAGNGNGLMSVDGSDFIRVFGDATFGPAINWSTGDSLRFATSDSAFGSFVERMRLDASGNLGLGVTPSAWLGNRKAFQIGLGGSIAGAANYFTELRSNSYLDGGGVERYISTNAASYYYLGAGTHAWFNAPSGTAGNAITFTQAMTLDASGNLGVGITSPTSRLHLKGPAGSNPNTNGIVFQYSTTTSNFGAIGLDNTSGDLVAASGGGAGIRFYTNSDLATTNERARITSAGEFLVGTQSLGGSGGVSIYGGSVPGITINKSASGGPFNAIAFQHAGTTVGTITTTDTATAYNTSSDYRLKENIAPMIGALAKIAALKPVTYKWKVDGSDGEGFIAHELAEVCPSAVVGAKDAVDAEGKPVYQGIDTSFLVATLTAALQEAIAEINQLKADVAALKGA
jgi:hypothetical protein